MSLRIVTAISAFVVLALAGCATSLDVQRLASGQRPPAESYYYVLPYTQFKATIARRVVRCEATDTHGTTSTRDDTVSTDMRIQTTATFATQQADDTRQRFAINAASLRHAFNAAKLELEYAKGTQRLQSINASVEGQGAVAARFLIPALGRLATVSAGAGGPDDAMACNEETRDAVALAVTQKRAVENATARVEALTAIVAQLRARRASWGDGVSNAVTGALRARLTELEAASNDLEQKTNALNHTLESITSTSEFVWPRSSADFSAPIYDRMDVATFRGWLNPEHPWIRRRPNESDATWAERTRHDLPDQRDYRKLDVHLFLEPQSSEFGVATPVSDEAVNERDGVRYRLPAPGRLVACASEEPQNFASAHPDAPRGTLQEERERACGALSPRGTKYANEVGRTETLVAQLGYIQRLPLRANAFESASFSATFDENGALTKSGYQATGAGSALTELLSLGLTQAAAVREAELAREQGEAARERDRAQALLATTQAQAALASTTDPNVIQTSALNVETALIRAQIAREEAARQWRTMNAGVTP